MTARLQENSRTTPVTQDDDYVVRVGRRRAKTPARDLYSMPYYACSDDGARVVYVGEGEPTCPDCSMGRLTWAEAGFVAWHRICDVCGSHFTLYPVPWGPARPNHPLPGRPATCAVVAKPPSASASTVARIPHVVDADCGTETRPAVATRSTSDEVALDAPAAEHAALVAKSRLLVHWVDGRGEVPLDPYERAGGEGSPTWGEFVALVKDEHWVRAEAEKESRAGMVVVPCSWARRARFY
jgi:hypothetical protein